VTPERSSTPETRPFTLWLYVLIVFALSWPFQIVALLPGHSFLVWYLLQGTSMCMVGVATFICARFVFRDGFACARWSWGRPRHYLVALALVAVLWVLPRAVDLGTGFTRLPDHVGGRQLAWVMVFLAAAFIPAFGQEFGWRGYLLPRLAQQTTPRTAVLTHALVWWAWLLPTLIGVACIVSVQLADQFGLDRTVVLAMALPLVLVLSMVPMTLHGVVVAYLWSWSGSLAVVVFYHAAHNGIRDSLNLLLGSGSLWRLWFALVLSVAGAVLLWRGRWERLKAPALSRDTGAAEGENVR
jgi:membrane protease YdiL (CAAX protease family)